jgi:hypothetical protein
MKLHLRANETNAKHTRLTLFVNGANCGELCLLNAEAIWLCHILSKGTDALSPAGRIPIDFVSSGRFPEPDANEIDDCVRKL